MSTKNKIATRACNAQIVTCMSVNGIKDETVNTEVGRTSWILSMMGDGTYEQDSTSQGGGSNSSTDGPQLSLETLCEDPGVYANGRCAYPGQTIEGLKEETCEPLGTWSSTECIFTDATNLSKFELPNTRACSGSEGIWTCGSDCFCSCPDNKESDSQGGCIWTAAYQTEWTSVCEGKKGTTFILPNEIYCKISSTNVSGLTSSECTSAGGEWVEPSAPTTGIPTSTPEASYCKITDLNALKGSSIS